jgi:hypothetical protein
MLPTKEQAIDLLNQGYEKNPGPWKDHSIIVAKCAYYIAQKCTSINPEKALIFGLLHDIGRREGVTHLAHIIDGYHYLMSLGFDEPARICITHSFAIKDINTAIGTNDISNNEYNEICKLLEMYVYDDYDLLIQLCDSISFATGSGNIIERMNDVKKRYGNYPKNKWDKHIEILNYFENKTGLDINHLGIDLVSLNW